MRVCVVGLGYIGLPTAAVLASKGHDVLGVDASQPVLERIRTIGAPPEEPGLADLVKDVISSGKLRLAMRPESSDAFILCLPTPIKEDRRPDLDYVVSGMAGILPVLERGCMVILESTVPPGTTSGLVAGMVRGAGLDPARDVDIAYAPERVIPGNILEEIQSLDRVMGGFTPRAAERARELYSTFVSGSIHLTDATTAEFVKLVENSYRDVNIAFANELARLAPDLGIDIWEAIEIANRHPRVTIHRPGPGVGGHCIAVDPYFIIDAVGPDRARFLALAREVNSSMPGYVAGIIRDIIGALEGKRVALLGIAYKGDVGDPRESPGLTLAHILAGQGAEVRAHDPLVKPGDVGLKLMNLESAVRGADILVITTDHSSFKDLDPASLGEIAGSKIILDTRNIIDPESWSAAGWTVRRLGASP